MIEQEKNCIVSFTLFFHLIIRIGDAVVFEIERERAASRRIRCASVLIEHHVQGKEKKNDRERKTDSSCLSSAILLSSTFFSLVICQVLLLLLFVERIQTTIKRTIYVIAVVVIIYCQEKEKKVKKNKSYCPYFIYLIRILLSNAGK